MKFDGVSVKCHDVHVMGTTTKLLDVSPVVGCPVHTKGERPLLTRKRNDGHEGGYCKS